METKFELKMTAFAKKNGLLLSWQDMVFGHRRACISCGSRNEFQLAMTLAKKLKGVWTDYWFCSDGGVFESYVYAMDADEHRRFLEEAKREQDRVEDWWQRYHAADTDTRRLMACGAIE